MTISISIITKRPALNRLDRHGVETGAVHAAIAVERSRVQCLNPRLRDTDPQPNSFGLSDGLSDEIHRHQHASNHSGSLPHGLSTLTDLDKATCVITDRDISMAFV